MYEVKVLALLYLRATARNWHFLLGTSVEDAGKFDDVRLAYTATGSRPRQMLIQLKHKESRSISKTQLLADDTKKHSFSLIKYYKSFCSLLEDFPSNAVLNSYSLFGDIDFVLCTNAVAEASEGVFTDADLLEGYDGVLNMGGKVFSFARNQCFIDEFKKKHVSDSDDDDSVKKFFDQFYIYSDQLREQNLEKQMREEIETSYSVSDYGANKVTASLVEYIQAWWNDRTNTCHLKRGELIFESGSEILKEFHNEAPRLEFKPSAIFHIKKNISNESTKIIHCVIDVDTCGPSFDKLAQSITESSMTFLAVTLEDIESSCERVLLIWPSKLCQILVIKFEAEMKIISKIIKEVSAQLKKVLEVEEGSKLILVSQNGELGKLFYPDDLKTVCTELNITCEINDLTKECQEQVLQNKINFQDSSVKLQSVLGENCHEAIDAHLLSLLTYRDEIIHLGCMQERKQSFYIDRVLTRNSFLKKNVLRSSSRDIFAISGVTSDQMQTFLEMTERSCESKTIASVPDSEHNFGYLISFFLKNISHWYSDGTYFDSTVTASHLFLRTVLKPTIEYNYQEKQNILQLQNCEQSNTTMTSVRKSFHIICSAEEFSQLCMKYERKNVHWLVLDDGKLKWKKSKGSLDVIKGNISPLEESFSVNNVWDIPDRIVVVTGDSGMGKSTLLNQISENSKEKRPDTCIILINLKECEDDLNNLDLAMTLEKTCEFIIRNSMLFEKNYQTSYISFFKYILMQTNRAVVLVDGFDDVYPENERKVVHLIKTLIKLPISKLWITTRQHMIPRLERLTRTIYFELHPLTLSQREELFRKSANGEEHDKLSELKIISDPRNFELLSNPLNCKMFAEVAQNNIDLPKFSDCIIGNEMIISSLAILEAIVNTKCEIYCRKHRGSILENKPVHEMSEMKNHYIENHQLSALLDISSLGIIRDTGSFDEREIKRRLKDFIVAIKTGSGVTGMINTVRKGIPQFEHRMYADYFLALWMKENCYGSHSNLAKIILQRIIFDPRFLSVVEFFNVMMSKNLVLHTAVLQSKESSNITKILKSKKEAEINKKDEAGRTAMHLALSLWCNTHNYVRHAFAEKQIKVIGELLRLGSDPSIKDYILKWSPFRYSNIKSIPWNIVAIMMKHNGILRSDTNELIERVRTEKLDTLAGLAHAVSFGNMKLVYFLLVNGVDVNSRVDEMGDTALIIAAAHGQCMTLQWLHSTCHAKPELRNNNGDSPLHWACLKGHIKIVKYLITECKINPYIENNSGYTPLLAAARGGHLKIVHYLRVTYNSDPGGRTTFGQSALCLAAGFAGDDPSVVKYLVEECGLNPKECEKPDCLPIYLACVKRNVNILKFFIDSCAIDPMMMNNDGLTLLHMMTVWLSADQLKEFVRYYKYSLDTTDNWGRTTLMCALLLPQHETCQYLRKYCTNIKSLDLEGNSALHFYLVNCKCIVSLDVVKWLVEKCKMDLSIANSHGLTALECAISKYHNPATKCFIQPDVVEYLTTKTRELNLQ